MQIKAGNLIPYGKHYIDQNDIDSVLSVLKSNFLTQGPKVPELENKLNLKIGCKYSVAVNSATSALHIACLAIGLREEDEVWTSPITFVSSANCVRFCNAKISFVDINKDTWCIDVDLLEAKLKYRKKNNLKIPKIIIAVHLSGQSCEMEKIHFLSKEYGFFIIEDASHAVGGKYKSHNIGDCRFSDISVFSFHPVKIITSGEGGLATTNNKNLFKKMSLLRSHGINKKSEEFINKGYGPWYYEQQLLGYNYRMTDIHAALCISQLDKLESNIKKRNSISEHYEKQLKHVSIRVQEIPEFVLSARHLFIIRVDQSLRNNLFKELLDNKIGVNLHYFPVHLQPYYRSLGFKDNDFPEAELYSKEAITIPLFPELTNKELKFICSTINNYFHENSL